MPQFIYYWTLCAAVLYAMYFAWGREQGFVPPLSGWWAMRRLGYKWARHRYYYDTSDHWADRNQEVWRMSDGLWYAQQDVRMIHTADDWNSWRSDVGFADPVTAHINAEVQGWRAL